MSGADNQFQKMAADAAERLQQDRELQQQLTMLPDDVPAEVEPEEPAKVGRPAGSKNKVSNQMREWLAHRGYRLPEEVLGQMLGQAGGDTDLMAETFRDVERLMAWAVGGASVTKWDASAQRHVATGETPHPTLGQRLETFQRLYAQKLRAAEALLPYGAPKASPDTAQPGRTVVVVPVAAEGSRPAPQDVTPQAGDLPAWQVAANRRAAQAARGSATDAETVENQQVSENENQQSSADRRTDQESEGKSDG